MPLLSTVTVPNHNGVAKDVVKWSLAFNDPLASQGNVLLWWQDFLSTVQVNTDLQDYIAECMDWTGAVVAVYDLTGHLDGTAHGSPTSTLTNGFTNGAGLANPFANQVTAVMSFTDDVYATEPTVAGMGEVPTPEQAQDYGAPATHTGRLLGKARHAGRIYFGPLRIDSNTVDANHNPTVGTHFLEDAVQAWTNGISGGSHDNAVHPAVWSRRDAALHTVTAGWIDHGMKNRRRREFVPNARSTF